MITPVAVVVPVNGGEAHNAAAAAVGTNRPLPTRTDAPMSVVARALRRNPDQRRA